ncbi:hypothetical protein VU04_01765 [Desulfobulbus sp. TB]|nr:hypothetical protein [Desulfobulbus sp. TB]
MKKEAFKNKLMLEVPFNWDLELLNFFNKINNDNLTKYPVSTIYASDSHTIVGSGRGGNTLPKREKSIDVYINKAHKYNIKFYYVYNSISLKGKEWDLSFQKQLYNELQDMNQAGLDGVIVSFPHLALLINKWFPNLHISSSVNNEIYSVERALQLMNYIKIDQLILPFLRCRDFPFIRELKSVLNKIDLVILVNESCLPDCAIQRYHQDYYNTISILGTEDISIPPDIYHIWCMINKLSNPMYALKAPWIRPEDIYYLEELGVSLVKLAGRTKSSEWISEMVLAYSRGSYNGNIFKFIEKSGLWSPEWEKILEKKLDPCHYHVESKDLDGFIEPFVKGTVPCVNRKYCNNCNWCKKWMHVVSLPHNRDERLQDAYNLLDHVKSLSVK